MNWTAIIICFMVCVTLLMAVAMCCGGDSDDK